MIGNTVGSYKITKKIGEGGMGTVFKGIDTMLEREVAIKMLRPELAYQPNLAERFRSEAVTLAKLNHPNIATLYSFIRQGDDLFMVMEYVRGETLEHLIEKSGSLPLEQAITLFCQSLEGMEHAHRLGIVHRDIKPANMMQTDTGSIKVMDFGIARLLGSGRMTKTGHLIGTIEYMSPEQIRGQEIDTRSDIYSLGILLYEMLTGHVPFTSDSEYALMRAKIEEAPTPLSNFVMHVPVSVEETIMRALAKKPEFRYQTAREFRAALLSGSSETVPYRASAIRVGNPSIPSTRFEEIIKETKLVDDFNDSTVALKNQIPVTGFAIPSSAQPLSTQSQAVSGLTALLRNRFTWKHYAVMSGLLVALIGIPFAFRDDKDRDKNKPASQPTTTTTTTPGPPVQQEVAPVTPIAEPTAPPEDSFAGSPSADQPAAETRQQNRPLWRANMALRLRKLSRRQILNHRSLITNRMVLEPTRNGRVNNRMCRASLPNLNRNPHPNRHQRKRRSPGGRRPLTRLKTPVMRQIILRN